MLFRHYITFILKPSLKVEICKSSYVTSEDNSLGLFVPRGCCEYKVTYTSVSCRTPGWLTCSEIKLWSSCSSDRKSLQLSPASLHKAPTFLWPWWSKGCASTIISHRLCWNHSHMNVLVTRTMLQICLYGFMLVWVLDRKTNIMHSAYCEYNYKPTINNTICRL